MTKERPGEREAFEKWATRAGYEVTRSDIPCDRYVGAAMDAAWGAWLARATLSARGGTEGGDGTLPQYVEEAIGAHVAAASSCGANAWAGSDEDCAASNAKYDETRAALCAAIMRYAAPTRARQDALEEAARVCDEVAEQSDPAKGGGNGFAVACLVSQRDGATKCAAAIRALSPADGGGRG